MELKVGTLLEGTVKSITKFGAFVNLPENQTGMVHISEVANAFVSDISQHLTQGQTVKVKVLSIDEAGKISLSIKRAEERPLQQGNNRPFRDNGNRAPRQDAPKEKAPEAPLSFEEKLKQFMNDSDSKISGCGLYERRSKTRRR